MDTRHLNDLWAKAVAVLRPSRRGGGFVADPPEPGTDSDNQTGRRVPLRLAGAVLGVILLLVVLVVSSLNSPLGDKRTPAAKQGTGNQPWWASDDSASPSATPTVQASSGSYLIVGPETGTPSPTATPAPVPVGRGNRVPKPAPGGGASYTGIAGDSCQHDATKGYQEIGRYTDGARGWYSRSSGGWDRDNCDGGFDALPMSGDPNRDDTSAFVVWWFKPPNLRQGTCALSVYIPTGREFADVAGRPAFYNVVPGAGDYRRLAGFRIDQVANRGRWLAAGSFPLRDGQLAVQLVTRGQDPEGEHLAAAQIKAVCR